MLLSGIRIIPAAFSVWNSVMLSIDSSVSGRARPWSPTYSAIYFHIAVNNNECALCTEYFLVIIGFGKGTHKLPIFASMRFIINNARFGRTLRIYISKNRFGLLFDNRILTECRVAHFGNPYTAYMHLIKSRCSSRPSRSEMHFVAFDFLLHHNWQTKYSNGVAQCDGVCFFDALFFSDPRLMPTLGRGVEIWKKNHPNMCCNFRWFAFDCQLETCPYLYATIVSSDNAIDIGSETWPITSRLKRFN